MLVDKWTHGGDPGQPERPPSGVARQEGRLEPVRPGPRGRRGDRDPDAASRPATATRWPGGSSSIGSTMAAGRSSSVSTEACPPTTRAGSRRFAHRRNSSHAVYVQSYDRVRGRVWLMDPLAEGTTRASGSTSAPSIASPRSRTARSWRRRPRPAASADLGPAVDHAYRLAGLAADRRAVAGSTVGVQVSLSIGDGFPNPTPHRFVGRWDPVWPEPPRRTRPAGRGRWSTPGRHRERSRPADPGRGRPRVGTRPGRTQRVPAALPGARPSRASTG